MYSTVVGLGGGGGRRAGCEGERGREQKKKEWRGEKDRRWMGEKVRG